MRVSIVIPVFNDTRAIPEMLNRLFTVAEQFFYSLEIVIVDDGSLNDSWNKLKEIKLSYPEKNIILLRLDYNSGQNNATLCGLMHSSQDFIVTLDADLQHPPEEIPFLLEKLSNTDFDLVYGTAKDGHPWPRRVTSSVFRILVRSLNSRNIEGSAFRAMKKHVTDSLKRRPEDAFIVIDTPLQEIASRATTISVEHHSRKYGQSAYSWKTLGEMAGKIIAHSKEFRRTLNLAGTSLIFSGMLIMLISSTLEIPRNDHIVFMGFCLILSGTATILAAAAAIKKGGITTQKFILREKIE